MKKLILLVCFMMCAPVNADEQKAELALSQEELMTLVVKLNKAQNKAMLKGSTVADVDALFNLYTHDFSYVHEVYGGTYTREHLYRNTVRYLNSGGYNKIADRYTIVNPLFGDNTVALQRLEDSGAMHLAVIEFEGKEFPGSLNTGVNIAKPLL